MNLFHRKIICVIAMTMILLSLIRDSRKIFSIVMFSTKKHDFDVIKSLSAKIITKDHVAMSAMSAMVNTQAESRNQKPNQISNEIPSTKKFQPQRDETKVDPLEPRPYVFEEWEDKSYTNKTFSFDTDVATDRSFAPECKTVFESVKRRFAERFASVYDAIDSIEQRPNDPPKYPSPSNGTGAILWLRHVHKTGGSTVRHLFETYAYRLLYDTL